MKNKDEIKETKQKKSKLLWRLFINTFTVSAFTFGGGYVIVAIMQKKFVEKLGWLSEQEMLDMVALAQAAPGPVAINTSLLVGQKLAGIPGALITILGTALPPFIIICIVYLFYNAVIHSAITEAVLRGMRAGVAAVIVDVVIKLGKDAIKKDTVMSLCLMIPAFVLTTFFGVNVMYIIIACAAVGIASAYIRRRA